MPQLQPYMSLIRKCPLLKDVPEEQYGSAFACIRTRICQAPKDSIVLALGDPFRYAYYLLEGCLVSTFQTATYDQITLNLFLPGDLLGESFACIPDSVSTIQLSASCDSVYLQFDLQPLLGKNQCGTCSCVSPSHHHTMLVNLLDNMAHTNSFLNEKVLFQYTSGFLQGHHHASFFQDKNGRISGPEPKRHVEGAAPDGGGRTHCGKRPQDPSSVASVSLWPLSVHLIHI